MPEDKLCESCRRVLSGERSESGFFVKHYPDADSFREAMRLPCSLCTFRWPNREGGLCSIDDSDLGSKISYLTNVTSTYSILTFGTQMGDLFNSSFRPNQSQICLDKLQSPELPSMYSEKLLDNTGSPLAINFLKEKYRDCREKHAQCRLLPSSPSSYPARLIDVGSPGAECIHLRDMPKLSVDESYFCLSHCWGKKVPYCLNAQTAVFLRGGLSLTTLPKTFQDAVLVTRKFGVRYLWVDSLQSCIFQDSIDDWSVEAGRMRDIYRHAACTIAATAAKDSSEGLFFSRDPEYLRPRIIHIDSMMALDRPSLTAGRYCFDHLGLWDNFVDHAPLNTRAWVMQERFLSSRIMHFSSAQLFWECYEERSSEKYPNGLPSTVLSAAEFDPLMLKYAFHSHRPAPGMVTYHEASELYRLWRGYRHSYSKLSMSKEEDKLVALQGIAKEVGAVLDDELVAGLWKNRMVEELCWFVNDTGPYNEQLPPMKWRAPTWSWACTNKTVSNGLLYWEHQSCPTKQLWAELNHLDVDTKISGEVIRASLRLTCRPIRAEITSSSLADFIFHFTFERSGWVIKANTNPTSGMLFLRDRGIACNETQSVCVVAIHSCVSDQHHSQDVVEGLIIKTRPGSRAVFKRIGYFYTSSGEEVEQLVKNLKATEVEVITLV